MKQLLKDIHFSEVESEVYVHLLSEPGKTVFQISKDLHISRAVLYPVIHQMHDKNYVLIEHGKKDLYYPQHPETLLKQLKSSYNTHVEALEEALKHVNLKPQREPYINMFGYFEILGQIRTLLYGAKEEVYINTDMDIEPFDDAFSHLERKGVDVYVFSFRNYDYKRTNVHIFSHQYPSNKQTRMMLVVDLETVLVANHDLKRDEWHATVTRNPLMVRIITEHIHHDIYILRLNRKRGVSIFSDDLSLFIGTKFEKQGKKDFSTSIDLDQIKSKEGV